MPHIQIKHKDANDAVSLSTAEVEQLFAEYHPDWAVESAVYSMTNTDDNEDFEFIDMSCVPSAFEVLDIDTAASESGMGAFNADTWCDDDADDAIASWIEDIEMNLSGLVVSRHDGYNSEFFVKVA